MHEKGLCGAVNKPNNRSHRGTEQGSGGPEWERLERCRHSRSAVSSASGLRSHCCLRSLVSVNGGSSRISTGGLPWPLPALQRCHCLWGGLCAQTHPKQGRVPRSIQGQAGWVQRGLSACVGSSSPPLPSFPHSLLGAGVWTCV